jgi:secreted PhoX family phosphatase
MQYNNKQQPTLQQIMLTRRSFLQASAVMMAGSALPISVKAATHEENLGFAEIAKNNDITHHIPQNYTAKPILKWGDFLGGDDLVQNKPFDAQTLNANSQAKSFGYNNDFIAFMPLPKVSSSSTHGLLCVNHEYTNSELMFSSKRLAEISHSEKSAIEMAAHGCSVVEVQRIKGEWQMVQGSQYNRRITATNLMQIKGNAAGDVKMRTEADNQGRLSLGTLGNCSGGTTPWGTVLTAEENFDFYFAGNPKAEYAAAYKRYGVGAKPLYQWHKSDKRFDVSVEPNESNRFGWIVEYDPYNPQSTPIKRTSLGRFKHECARTHVNYDGRIVVYSGDDEMFEYLYRYVSHDKYIAGDDAHNATLLDEGELSVARFNADGTLTWLPLVHGKGGLDKANGFHSQADVLINARGAGDVVGATPMDRPEDIEIHPHTGAVYVSLTMNVEREEPNSVNVRAHNKMGHILQLNPSDSLAGKDHAAEIFTWQPFLLAGNPDEVTHGAKYQNAPSKHGWLSNPDNLAIDAKGNLWVATDGQQKHINANEGLYAAPTHGKDAGKPKCFLTAPIGAEVTGQTFTPDCKTLFVSIQHPAEGLHLDGKTKSNYDNPSTRYPDFKPNIPPRPCVLAITHNGDKIIGQS